MNLVINSSNEDDEKTLLFLHRNQKLLKIIKKSDLEEVTLFFNDKNKSLYIFSNFIILLYKIKIFYSIYTSLCS